jgi:alanine dehydrogenase
MIVGVPREVKSDEYRVGLRPVGAELLSSDGHIVLIERDAGLSSGFSNDDYLAAGATILDSAAEIWRQAELIVKVKEPQASEIGHMRPGQTVFTYFHFAASRELTVACLEAGITAVAYETLRDGRGALPLLTPMSEVAGRMSIQQGAKFLERPMMGRGILLAGVPGVEPANVVVLGGGVVGSNAARIAAGLGANVIIMDVNIDRLRELDIQMPANVTGIYSDPYAIDRYIREADLVIGAVLVPGARAPHLVSERQVHAMRDGAVIVDVAIDQGGCIETSSPTTHHDPTYILHGVVHYCVTNMPGAVGRTSTQALCNATLPYVRQLARLGPEAFAAQSTGHALSINMTKGRLTHHGVAEAFPDLPHV